MVRSLCGIWRHSPALFALVRPLLNRLPRISDVSHFPYEHLLLGYPTINLERSLTPLEGREREGINTFASRRLVWRRADFIFWTPNTASESKEPPLTCLVFLCFWFCLLGPAVGAMALLQPSCHSVTQGYFRLLFSLANICDRACIASG